MITKKYPIEKNQKRTRKKESLIMPNIVHVKYQKQVKAKPPTNRWYERNATKSIWGLRYCAIFIN